VRPAAVKLRALAAASDSAARQERRAKPAPPALGAKVAPTTVGAVASVAAVGAAMVPAVMVRATGEREAPGPETPARTQARCRRAARRVASPPALTGRCARAG